MTQEPLDPAQNTVQIPGLVSLKYAGLAEYLKDWRTEERDLSMQSLVGGHAPHSVSHTHAREHVF